jgi:glycosyltransferase involved in cell wall biosynthesis
VIDNNSTDRTYATAEELGVPVLKCIKQGRSCARNAGLKSTNSAYVAFVDSDVVLEKDWLQGLLSYFNNDCVGATQSKVIPLADKSFIDKYIYAYKEQFTHGTFVEMESLGTFNPILDTAACLYRREALEQVNGFDEKLRYLEDLDVSIRLSAQGYSLRANLGINAYKISNRSIFEFLIRTMHDAYDMYEYMAIHSGKKSLKELITMMTFTSKRKIQFRPLAFKFLTIANNFYWRLGFIQSFVVHYMKTVTRKEIKQKMAKMNLLMKQVETEKSGKKYVLSPSRRFYFSGRTLIIYGPKEENLLRYQDPEMLDFFKDYLDASPCDLSKHTSAISRAIQDQLFISI